MITSKQALTEPAEFVNLLNETRDTLNCHASRNPDYFPQKAGRTLENEVFKAMIQRARNTPFDGTIEIISGQKFPDIVAKRYYGVEVKSTTGDHWTTIGNSVLESTRVEEVARIYIMFGKLADPIEFRYKKYEECLSDIVVTHYPRYKVNMNLNVENTIFSKMKISYDELRKHENPVAQIANYYRTQLKEGESLWWIDDSGADVETMSATIKLYNALSKTEKKYIRVAGLSFFPELFRIKDPNKYNNFVFWLLKKYSVISHSTRDIFSAGGQFNWTDPTTNKCYFSLPHIFRYVHSDINDIIALINQTDEKKLRHFWKLSTDSQITDKISTWRELVLSHSERQGEALFNHLIQC